MQNGAFVSTQFSARSNLCDIKLFSAICTIKRNHHKSLRESRTLFPCWCALRSTWRLWVNIVAPIPHSFSCPNLISQFTKELRIPRTNHFELISKVTIFKLSIRAIFPVETLSTFRLSFMHGDHSEPEALQRIQNALDMCKTDQTEIGLNKKNS